MQSTLYGLPLFIALFIFKVVLFCHRHSLKAEFKTDFDFSLFSYVDSDYLSASISETESAAWGHVGCARAKLREEIECGAFFFAPKIFRLGKCNF